MEAMTGTTEINSDMATLSSISSDGKQEACAPVSTNTKTMSLKIKKADFKKRKKSELLSHRLSRLNMDICNVAGITQKFVNFTNKKIEMLEIKLEEMEKRLEKEDERHKIGYIVV